MSKSSAIHLVVGSTGEYDENIEWFVRSFGTAEEAQGLSDRLNAWCRERCLAKDGPRGVTRVYWDATTKPEEDPDFNHRPGSDGTGTAYRVVAVPFGPAPHKTRIARGDLGARIRAAVGTPEKPAVTPVRWRDDNLNVGDYPSVSSVVICAEDTIKAGEDHVLILVHVRAFHGKGFMASVRSAYRVCGSMANGNVFTGEGRDAYERALREGETLYAERAANLAREVAKYKDLKRAP